MTFAEPMWYKDPVTYFCLFSKADLVKALLYLMFLIR